MQKILPLCKKYFHCSGNSFTVLERVKNGIKCLPFNWTFSAVLILYPVFEIILHYWKYWCCVNKYRVLISCQGEPWSLGGHPGSPCVHPGSPWVILRHPGVILGHSGVMSPWGHTGSPRGHAGSPWEHPWSTWGHTWSTWGHPGSCWGHP